MTIRSAAFLTIVGMVPATLRAQVTPPPPPRPADQVVIVTPERRDDGARAVPTHVAGAEAEGRSWERTAGPSTQVPALRARFAPRIATPSCVAVTATGPVRSGDWIVSGQLRGKAGVRTIRWSPSHPTTSYVMAVRMRQLEAPGAEARFRSSNLAHHPTTGEFAFETDFVWPGPGRWMAVVSSGPDWGCFIFS